MLSSTCRYAIKAVIYIGTNSIQNQKIGIKKISAELDIPSPFLGKILQSLAKHKILTSIKGPNGGFGMGKKPEDIRLIEIVEIIDGIDNYNKCIIGVKECKENEDQCSLHSRYAPLRAEIKKIFEIETIADLVSENYSGKKKIFL
jgi:Rrf2 family protein